MSCPYKNHDLQMGEGRGNQENITSSVFPECAVAPCLLIKRKEEEEENKGL